MMHNHINFLRLFLFSSLFSVTTSEYEPICPDEEGASVYVPGPGCTTYFICSDGQLVSPVFDCLPGTLFDAKLLLCNFERNVECTSTPLPTPRPTKTPTVAPTTRLAPTTPSPTFPPQTRSPSANTAIEDNLHYCRDDINNKLLLYQTAWNDWLPSTQYRYNGFMKGLQIMYLEGINNMTFYLGEDVSGDEGTKIGLVNIAAFLAQSMKETIKYDSCDENNWDVVDGKYPLSNACGQLGQSYEDYTCPNGTEHFQCEVDPNMEMVASTHAHWHGAPGPLFCGPKSKYPYTGFWDYEYECDFPYKDPPEYCSDYPGQRGGRYDHSAPIKNRAYREDVEGCCWWGRGVIQTTGICNYGMLNYFLGKRAADEGRVARYGRIDFCKEPSAICNRNEYPELKWIAGMFYWVSSLQPYDNGWNYLKNLKEFVSGGMQNETFIDAVSGIVNRGCHNPPCGTGELDGGEERKENFKKVLDVLFDHNGSPWVSTSSDTPTDMPSVSGVATEQELTLDTSQSNEAEEEEEDWSQQVEANNAMNLWCGATMSEAGDNCGRDGYECPVGTCPTNDLKCFMVGDSCSNGETDTNLPTARPIGTSTTQRPTSEPTPKPSVQPTIQSSTTNNISEVKAQNYCAKRKVDLKTGCFTAQTCNGDDDQPCPVGTYCWGNIVCTEPNETLQPSPHPSHAPSQSPVAAPSQSPIAVVNGVCAVDYPELQNTCWNATKCSTINPCSDGKKCFGNIDCNFVSPKETILSSNDPTLQPTSTSGGSEIFYCAVSENELKKSCSSARRCVDGICPLGMLCIPFDCEQNQDVSAASSEPGVEVDNSHELCPDFFVGWHARADCKEYFECNNGQIGPLYTCEEGLRFEKVSGKCHDEREVNQNCYAIHVESIDDSNSNGLNLLLKPKCTLGYTGWDAKPGCSQYFWCSNGNEEASLDCGENLLFDLELELCNFADEVHCPYGVDPPTSSPTISKQVTSSPSTKASSGTDGREDFDKFPTTSSPTSTKSIALPPWLNDIKVTSNNGAVSAFPEQFAFGIMSLLSAFQFLACFI